MEKSINITPSKIAHRIPPRFLERLGITSVLAKFPNKSNSSVYLTALMDKTTEVGVVYECAEQLPKDGNIAKCVNNIRSRLSLRQNLSLALFPKILDYIVTAEPDKIKVVVLLEPLGKSIIEKSKENLKDYASMLPTWFFYIIRFLLYLSHCEAFPKLIRPELIFLKDDTVKLLDLDNVVANPLWIIDTSTPNTSWRNERWQGLTILVPPAFSTLIKSEGYSTKLQTYFLAVSFLALLAGERFIKKFSDRVLNDEKIRLLLRKKKKEIGRRIGNPKWFKKVWLLLEKSVSCCPGLCPTLDEIDSYLEKLEDTPYKAIKNALEEKCANCGRKLGKIVAPAYCSSLIVCQKCSLGEVCMMCGKNHKLGYTDDLHLRLVKEDRSKEYKIYPPRCVLRRDIKASSIIFGKICSLSLLL